MNQAQATEPPQTVRAADTDFILGELTALRDNVIPDPEVCVAILDGPVDLTHPCFADARITRADSLVLDEAGTGAMSGHGTHVTSIVFGKPGTGTLGLAAGCRGVVVPIFQDSSGHLTQLDLARAIERAMLSGADVINISGGELVERGEADPLLARTVEACERNGVLIVAAAGNDGCDCLHVPAALPTVLAVGALGRDGTALPSSNFGDRYARSGVLAPGESIPGAIPGGAIAELTGSSFATPIVTALVALLLSAQRRRGSDADVAEVRRAVIASALACARDSDPRCLAGILNVRGAHALITQGDKVTEMAATQIPHVASAGVDATPPDPGLMNPGPPPAPPDIVAVPTGVAPSCGGAPCSCGTTAAQDATTASAAHEAPTPPQSAHPLPVSNVFALGNIGFDFGTEARRDGFRQLMPMAESSDETPIVTEPNPYDAVQLANYLDKHPWESTKLIWTMNLNLTPIYAIEAEVTYHEAVYEMLRYALRCQVLPAEDDDFVSRVSLPGVLTNRTVTTFAGQRLPVIVVQRRGLYTWNENNLVKAVLGAIDFDKLTNQLGIDRSKAESRTELKLRQMLDKVYYELRNLGSSSADRAINYTATNAFIFSDVMAKGLLAGELVDGDVTSLYSLESITAVKSPFGRLDCDCWDVKITFFSPENERRARVVYQATVDVSDPWPVQLAPIHQYLISGG
ncbi:PatA/PatG family cyanobactin maturation protease [Mycobacterium sp. 20091114027_K0903767]|nr:PatA/PatG family cyanobactin maturation protease [Mycobacterium sp. 20091114027_K0903767]